MNRPSGPGTVALVLHSGSHSGPARNFASRFRGMDERLRVYAPASGPALELFSSFAEIHLTRHERLVMPRSASAAARVFRALSRDVVLFRRLFRRHAIDTVVSATTVTPAAAMAARTMGLTSIVYCGELFENGPSVVRRLSAGAMTTGIPRIADLVVCCSDRAAAQFRGDATKVVRLYPPIERMAPRLDRTEARARFGLPADRPVIVTIGQLSPGRGQDVAIAALGLLRDRSRDATLALAGAPGHGPGDERYATHLLDLAASSRLGSAVHFLGAVSDIASLLGAADVFVNPARFEEPFGRAALEALAAGVPAIVTRTGAQTELLQDEESALVVPPDDARSIAQAVERLLDSPALAERLVQGAAKPLSELEPDLDRDRFRELLAMARR